jgi:hypothetical protein
MYNQQLTPGKPQQFAPYLWLVVEQAMDGALTIAVLPATILVVVALLTLAEWNTAV